MTVKELIAQLSEFDENLSVQYNNWDSCWGYIEMDIETVDPGVGDYGYGKTVLLNKHSHDPR
jgi:hypothetical protein